MTALEVALLAYVAFVVLFLIVRARQGRNRRRGGCS